MQPCRGLVEMVTLSTNDLHEISWKYLLCLPTLEYISSHGGESDAAFETTKQVGPNVAKACLSSVARYRIMTVRLSPKPRIYPSIGYVMKSLSYI